MATSELNLTNEAEEFVLNFLYRDEGTRPSEVYLGLATAVIDDDDTLTDIADNEEDDTGYARQLISVATPDQDGGAGRVKNYEALEFGPWDAAADHTITYAFVATVSAGTGGMLVNWYELANEYQKKPALGESLTIPVDGWVQKID